MNDENRAGTTGLAGENAKPEGPPEGLNLITLTPEEKAFLLAYQEEVYRDRFEYGPAHRVLMEKVSGPAFRQGVGIILTASGISYAFDSSRIYEWPWSSDEEFSLRIADAEAAMNENQKT